MQIQCNGFQSCSQSDLISDNDAVICRGTKSCIDSELRAQKILCSADSGCLNSKLVADQIKIYGASSAANSEIYAAKVFGYGYYSLAFAQIDSLGNDKLDIKLFGHQTGYGLVIICREGANCKLTCKSSACYETTFLCVSGSKCGVTPNKCGPDYLHSQDYRLHDADCPYWKISLNVKEDMILLKERRTESKSELFIIDNRVRNAVHQGIGYQVLIIIICICVLYRHGTWNRDKQYERIR